MEFITIDKQDWPGGVEKLKGPYRVYGPVRGQEFSDFKRLEPGQLPDLTCLNTRLSPKGIVYPQSQPMFEYSLDEKKTEAHVLTPVQPDAEPASVLGIRPCDAKAFELVRYNFDTPEYKDPYWIQAFENTTFVGLACDSPCASCFCTTAGCGPYHEAVLDLLLVDAGDHYLAKVLTQKGARLLKTAGWEAAADPDASASAMVERKQAAEEKIRSRVRTDRLKNQPIDELYQAPIWEDVAFACINCGTCTYVCPTCWCFDVQDETHGVSGRRMRNWDSCMYPLFTLHGSGHNPRGTKLHRVRQRFMHKLKYFVDRYDAGIQCVGCGRCVRLCPVNIDIRKVCNMINGFDASACVFPASS